MPAIESFWRSSECFWRFSGMKGLEAAWPTLLKMFLIWALEERPRVTGSSTELLLRRWRMRRPSPPKRLATQNVINVTAPKMQAARIVVSSILDLDGCELSNCDEAGDLQSDG